MSIKNNITAIIITKDNHDKVKVMVEYLSEELGLSVIVSDGSNKEIKIPKCTYLFLPELSFSERFCAAVKQVNTEFTLTTADDDFVLRPGLEACIQALVQDPSAACASGLFYGLEIFSTKNVGLVHLYTKADLAHFYPRHPAKNMIRRVEYSSEYFRQLIWGVHRTDNLSRVCECFVEHNVDTTFLTETALTFGSLITGPCIAVSEAYCVRALTPRSADVNSHPLKYLYTRERHKMLEYHKVITALSSLVDFDVKEINDLSQFDLDFQSSAEWLDAVYKHSMLPSLIGNYRSVDFSKEKTFLKKIGLFVEKDEGVSVGDVDTNIETFETVLYYMNDWIKQEGRMSLFSKRRVVRLLRKLLSPVKAIIRSF